MQKCFAPLVVYDVARGREQAGRAASLENHEEVRFTVTLLNRLFHKYEADEVGSVAIITPYKAQARLLHYL